jgi:hypothetical protein
MARDALLTRLHALDMEKIVLLDGKVSTRETAKIQQSFLMPLNQMIYGFGFYSLDCIASIMT